MSQPYSDKQETAKHARLVQRRGFSLVTNLQIFSMVSKQEYSKGELLTSQAVKQAKEREEKQVVCAV